MLINKSWPTKSILAGAVMLAASGCIHAAEGQSSDSEWSGQFTFGITGFTGNAVMNFINASLEATYNQDFDEDDPVRHKLMGSYAFADYEIPSIDGFEFGTIDMIDNHSVQYQMDYFLGDRSYVSAMGMHYQDKPAGIELFNVIGVEYTHILSQTEGHQLSGTLGVAPFTETEYTDGQVFDGMGGKVSLNFSGQLTDSISLSQTAEVLTTENLTFTTTDTSAEMKLTETVSLQLSNNYKNFSEVPEGFKKSDNISSLNVVLGF